LSGASLLLDAPPSAVAGVGILAPVDPAEPVDAAR